MLENRLTQDQLLTLSNRIITRLTTNPANGYQPFGWDWPTLIAIYPREYRVFRRLRIVYQNRIKNKGEKENRHDESNCLWERS